MSKQETVNIPQHEIIVPALSRQVAGSALEPWLQDTIDAAPNQCAHHSGNATSRWHIITSCTLKEEASSSMLFVWFELDTALGFKPKTQNNEGREGIERFSKGN